MVKRTKTLCNQASLDKRKRDILREAIELSKLCGQEIYIAMGDFESKTLTEFSSVPNNQFEGYKQKEVYRNADYHELEKKLVPKKMHRKSQE